MSDVPSWLSEETVSAVANNKTVQKAAINAASNKDVQKAAVSAAVKSGSLNPSFAPAWAQSDYVPPPVAGVSGGSDIENTERITTQGANEPAIKIQLTEEEEKAMGKWHLILRCCYITSVIFMSVSAGLSLVGQTNLGKIFFALYVLLFCTLICCQEVALNAILRIIAMNFGFLYTFVGKITFILFIGFMSFSLGTLGIAAMAVLYAATCLQIYIMCKFPKFEAYVRQKHYYSGKQ